MQEDSNHDVPVREEQLSVMMDRMKRIIEIQNEQRQQPQPPQPPQSPQPTQPTQPTQPSQPQQALLTPLIASLMETSTTNRGKMGEALVNIFDTVERAVNESTATENPMGNLMNALVGSQMAGSIVSDLIKRVEIQSYFEKQLRAGQTLTDSVLATKAKFDLPDNYVIKLSLTVDFNEFL